MPGDFSIKSTVFSVAEPLLPSVSELLDIEILGLENGFGKTQSPDRMTFSVV